MSKQQEKKDGKQAFEKKVKVPAKIGVDKLVDSVFVAGKGVMTDSFTVLVTGPGFSRQFTYHHPIGVTDLGADDWVLTPTEEVQSLLARSEDPDAERINKGRQLCRLELAATEKLLMKSSAAGRMYDYPNGVDRAAVLETARNRVDEMHKLDMAKFKASVDAGKPMTKPVKGDPLSLLDENITRMESALRDFWKKPSVVAEVEAKWPSHYRTRSGPLGNRDQTSVVAEEGITLDTTRAADSVVRTILQSRLQLARFAKKKEDGDSKT